MDKKVLDVTCGGRSIWFDKNNPIALFCDKRECEYAQDFNGQEQKITIKPDVIADFCNLPFEDNTFSLVVFDPPHIIRKESAGENGWLTKKYGYYQSKQEAIQSVSDGINECMRVLAPSGVLIFKWAETGVLVSEIIKSCKIQPLFGHHSAKKSNTHWLCFMKL